MMITAILIFLIVLGYPVPLWIPVITVVFSLFLHGLIFLAICWTHHY